MSKQIVKFDILDGEQNVKRTVEIEVEGGKGFAHRAEAAVVKELAEGEFYRLVPPVEAPVNPPVEPPVVPPDKAPEVKTISRFTFEFEVYRDGKMNRTVRQLAVHHSEDRALESAIIDLIKELTVGETYRYTNRFTKEPDAA